MKHSIKNFYFIFALILVACNGTNRVDDTSDEILAEKLIGSWTGYDMKDIVFEDTKVVTELSKGQFRADQTDTGWAEMRFVGKNYPEDLGAFKMRIDSIWRIENGTLIQNITNADVAATSDYPLAVQIAKDMKARSLSTPEFKSDILKLSEDKLVIKLETSGMIMTSRRDK